MTDRTTLAAQLDAMAWQVRRWLEWHREHREKENLVTGGDTSIMGLPVPMWPSRGQFEVWIKTMDEAGRELRGVGEIAEDSK